MIKQMLSRENEYAIHFVVATSNNMKFSAKYHSVEAHTCN